VLRGKVYPRQKWVTEEQVLEYRDELLRVGLIYLYTHDDEIYLCMNKWDELQKVRTPRRKFPIPNKKNRYSNNSAHSSATFCNNLQQTETERDKKMSTCARAESNPIQSNPIHLESDSESNLNPNPKKQTKKFVDEFFEKAWSAYHRKLGKGRISDAAKKRAFKLGDEFLRCIERYKESTVDTEKKYILHGSTFFNSGYVDFLDENYTPPEPEPKKTDKFAGSAAKYERGLETKE